MNRKIGILVAAIAVVLMVNAACAQTIELKGEKNAVAKHTFYNSVNGSANTKFAEMESMIFIVGNNNIKIDLIDWGKEDCKKAILLEISYQNQSNIIPLERGWGTQVAEMQLAKNVHLTIGLTELFLGSPTKFASISTSLWVLE